jgi:hypothetical protein
LPALRAGVDVLTEQNLTQKQRFEPVKTSSEASLQTDKNVGGCGSASLEAASLGRVVGITASLLTAAPASALACPVCALVGTGDNTWAYQAMSAMLTLLPLAMVGAIVWWLARLAARADTERQPATQHGSTTDRSVGVASGGLVSVTRRAFHARVGADLQVGRGPGPV